MALKEETLEVGKKLVALCKEGKNLEAIDNLYADEIESFEAMAMPDGSTESKGKKAVRDKNVWWFEHMKVHSTQSEGPYPNGNRFAVRFKYDATDKDSGKRETMEEVGLYTVKNGKIVREEFFASA